MGAHIETIQQISQILLLNLTVRCLPYYLVFPSLDLIYKIQILSIRKIIEEKTSMGIKYKGLYSVHERIIQKIQACASFVSLYWLIPLEFLQACHCLWKPSLARRNIVAQYKNKQEYSINTFSLSSASPSVMPYQTLSLGLKLCLLALSSKADCLCPLDIFDITLARNFAPA